MQVGGLGFVHSIVIQKGGELPAQESGFASILSGLVQPLNSSLEAGKTVNEDGQQLTKNELTELVQLLKTSDVSDFENGSMPLDQMHSDGDITEFIKEGLQLTNEDLISAILSVLNGLNVEKNEVDVGFSEDDLKNLIEDLPQMDANEALISFTNILPFIKMDQMSLTANQNFADLAKSLKLFELLHTYENTNAKQPLKEFLQKTGEKLEVLLKENSLASRSGFLHKVFTPVAKEMNEQIVINQQTQSVLSSTDQEVMVKSTGTLGSINEGMFQFQQMSKPEQLTLMLDKSGQPVSAEKLIQQFEEILSKGQFFKTGGTQKLFIKLNPDHLGALRVELIQKDSALIAKIVTTTSTAKDILESQLQSLKNAFSSQNIQVERIEISQQMSQQERFLNKDSQQQQEQKQQRQQEEQKQHEQQFMVSFEEELINAEV